SSCRSTTQGYASPARKYGRFAAMLTFRRSPTGERHRLRPAKPGAAAKTPRKPPLQSALPGGVPEWPKGTGCKPVGSAYGGSNPPAPILLANSGYGSAVAMTTSRGFICRSAAARAEDGKAALGGAIGDCPRLFVVDGLRRRRSSGGPVGSGLLWVRRLRR